MNLDVIGIRVYHFEVAAVSVSGEGTTPPDGGR